MLSFARKWILAGLLSSAAFTHPAMAAATDFDGMVTVGQHQLQVAQAGQGPYTVVFEAGFASDQSVWRKVAPEVAKKAAVLVYSRAGYGKSPARTQPLTLEQSVAELAAVLEARKVQGPLDPGGPFVWRFPDPLFRRHPSAAGCRHGVRRPGR